MDTAMGWIVEKGLDQLAQASDGITLPTLLEKATSSLSSGFKRASVDSATSPAKVARGEQGAHVLSTTLTYGTENRTNSRSPIPAPEFESFESQALLPTQFNESCSDDNEMTQKVAYDETLFSFLVNAPGGTLGVIKSNSSTMEVTREKLKRLLLQKYPEYREPLKRASRDCFSITMVYQENRVNCIYELRNLSQTNPLWINEFSKQRIVPPQVMRPIEPGMTIILLPPLSKFENVEATPLTKEPELSFVFTVNDV